MTSWPGGLAVARGRVGAYMLAQLPATTRDRYERGLAEQLGRSALQTDLPDEVLDWAVADYLLDGIEEGTFLLSGAQALIAALRKRDPRLTLTVAAKLLQTWRRGHPPVQAVALPGEVVNAMFALAWLTGDRLMGSLFLVCFAGLLRIGEGLLLRRRQLVFTAPRGDAVIIMLGRTKRGVDDKVELTNPVVVEALRLAAAAVRDDSARLFPFGYDAARKALQSYAAALGIDTPGLRTHSLRRGGATELYRKGVDLGTIIIFGRWASERSARLYIKGGEAALLRTRARASPLTARLAAVAAYLPRLFPKGFV